MCHLVCVVVVVVVVCDTFLWSDLVFYYRFGVFRFVQFENHMTEFQS
jgi:hypothetical protein